MESYLYKDLYELETQHWWHKAKRLLVKKLLDRFGGLTENDHKPKLLDIGCGTGHNLSYFSERSTPFGVDASEDAIKYCKKRGLSRTQKASAEKLLFDSNFFDLALMLDVLEHIPEQTSLKELLRVLKPSSIAIISVPAFSWLWSRWDEVLHHRQRYSRQELLDAVEKAGFEPIFSSYAYSFLVIPVLLIRKLKDSIYKDKSYPSDFKLSNPLLNFIGLIIAKIEQVLILQGGLPIGTSLFMVVRPRKKL